MTTTNDLLSPEQLAKWQQVFTNGNLNLMYVTASIDNMRALLAHTAALQAQLDDVLNRSHQTVLFECGCMFKQEGLDAEPQLVVHCQRLPAKEEGVDE